jgi:hypothetical protein
MGVMEGEAAGFVQRRGIADGASSRKQQQGGKSGPATGGLRTERFDLPRDDSQHY